MRAVFLSSLIEQPLTQGSGRITLPSNPSFARVLEQLQRTSATAASGRTGATTHITSGVAQPSVSSRRELTEVRASLLPLRFTGDTRFLTPQSTLFVRPILPKSTAQALQKYPAPSTSGQQATIRTYGTAITATSRQLGVDPALSLAVARAESGVSGADEKDVVLNPRAVSSAGAAGLFQLMSATGKEQLQAIAPNQKYNPFNPDQNIRLGVNYLKEMSDTFSEKTPLGNGLSAIAGANAHEVRRLAVAAYNAGPGRVARAQELARVQGRNPAYYQDVAPYLPQETQQYVARVERFAGEFRKTASATASTSMGTMPANATTTVEPTTST